MKTTHLVLYAVAVVSGCSLNTATPTTSWGKQGISMIDYRTDSGQCALIGATYSYDENGAKAAGGITGQNSGAPTLGPSGATAANSAATGGGNTSATGPRTVGNTTYRDSASADFVNRAAMQQRSQEMAAQRARNDALKFCLVSRGYTEFELTREQRQKLERLPRGSDERREYLYSLATDPDVLGKQQVVHK
jgi:hypothetical protein